MTGETSELELDAQYRPLQGVALRPAAPVPRPMHVLICEDSEDDAFLIVMRLRRDGLDLTYDRVDTATATAAALRAHPPDVVLSDYNMPGFHAEEALRLVSCAQPDLPFILVSGQIGEEAAAALMRAGAHDFVLKDRLARLAPAIQRELREAESRRNRRRTEAELVETGQRFRLFAEHAQDIIFRYRIHPRAEVEYLSPATGLILGHPPDELTGDPARLFGVLEPADRMRLKASWHSAHPAGLTVCWRRPDETIVWTEQRAVGVHDGTGRLVAVEGILRDVTEQMAAAQERERLEQQLRQAERLEAVGQLAGGIAHDFNNLLGVILGNADLAMESLPAGHPVHEDLAAVYRAAERGAALTRQLLIFSRLEPAQVETLDLNAVVAETEQLLSRTIGEDLRLTTRLAAELPPVSIDRSRLEQILLNLVVNARGAMPEGGRLTIETVCVPDLTATDRTGADTHQSGALRRDRAAGPWIRMRVTDTGCGMPPEVAERVFEPFFTTKGPGEGTGLGLSTVYGAVTEAGGQVSVDSELGVGTTVTVLFPPAVPIPAAETPVGRAAQAPPGHVDATVLVVEDEDALRAIIRRTLSGSGYRVVEASTPDEALHVFRELSGYIDVLLTDIVMPGMSGHQLAERLHRVRPKLPVLFMSGYVAGSQASESCAASGAPLIRKPFTGAALLIRLHEVLGH